MDEFCREIGLKSGGTGIANLIPQAQKPVFDACHS
jgi:hypothetical protein